MAHQGSGTASPLEQADALIAETEALLAQLSQDLGQMRQRYQSLLELLRLWAGGLPPASATRSTLAVAAALTNLSDWSARLASVESVLRQSLCSDNGALDNLPGSDSPLTAALRQAAIIQIQEEERYRLARDIHDGPAQNLANAVFEIDYCTRVIDHDPQKAKQELSHLRADIQAALNDVRRFIFDLRPPPLGELRLNDALWRYSREYKARFGIQVDLQLDPIGQHLPLSLEIALFRIVQEALQNVRKHAGASLISIGLNRQGDGLVVTIKDNGRGFDPTAPTTLGDRHLGLISMRERAQLVHGQLQIISAPGQGTTVILSIPRLPASEETIETTATDNKIEDRPAHGEKQHG